MKIFSTVSYVLTYKVGTDLFGPLEKKLKSHGIRLSNSSSLEEFTSQVSQVNYLIMTLVNPESTQEAEELGKISKTLNCPLYFLGNPIPGFLAFPDQSPDLVVDQCLEAMAVSNLDKLLVETANSMKDSLLYGFPVNFSLTGIPIQDWSSLVSMDITANEYVGKGILKYSADTLVKMNGNGLTLSEIDDFMGELLNQLVGVASLKINLLGLDTIIGVPNLLKKEASEGYRFSSNYLPYSCCYEASGAIEFKVGFSQPKGLKKMDLSNLIFS